MDVSGWTVVERIILYHFTYAFPEATKGRMMEAVTRRRWKEIKIKIKNKNINK